MSDNMEKIIKAAGMLFFFLQPPLCIPNILRLKKAGGKINPLKTTLWSSGILIGFIFLGGPCLNALEVSKSAFCVAGGIVFMAIGLELTFGSTIFHLDLEDPENISITPLAFPMFAGTGTMTLLLNYQIKGYEPWELIVALFPNLLLIYFTLVYAESIGRFMGSAVTLFLGKIVGVLLIAMAVSTLKENFNKLGNEKSTAAVYGETAPSQS